MKKAGIIFMAACGILLASCNKNPLPEVTVGDIVFEFDGMLDGLPVSLEAGKQGVYQAISLTQTDAGLYQFSGSLGTEGCDDCPDQILLTFRDQELSDIGESLPVSRAPGVNSYSFFQDGDKGAKVEVAFELDDGFSPAQHSWDFGDGGTSLELSPVHIYSDTVGEVVTVCLQTSDGAGCVSSICNSVNLKDTACQAAFQFEVDASSQFVTFMDRSKGKLPMKYNWSFGDGYSATLGNPGYYYGQNGKYDACLEIEDATGCVSEICKEISPDLTTCTAGFNYRVTRIESGEVLQENTVTISRIDENGEIYSSASAAQDAQSYFEVLKAERYREDQNGLAAWKLDFRVRSLVADEEGKTKILEGIGKMAIGIPLEE